MHTVVLFGYPGVGKTFVGTLLRDEFGYFLYDGDRDLPEDMKKAIEKSEPVTNQMRDEFFAKIISKTKVLAQKHKRLVVAQAFIKEKHRKAFLDEFFNAKFFLITSKDSIREKRLTLRKDFPLDIIYVRRMCENFDPVITTHSVVNNNRDGNRDIKKQLKSLLQEDL